MRLLGYSSIALVPLLVLFASCNEPPTQPPIDTSGSGAPGAGGAGLPASSSDDAGTSDAALEDSATDATTSDASNNCLFGTCGGCCTPTGQCVAGGTLAQCGASGVACQTCTTNQVSTTIGCQ
jgi:hypothetical protein